MVMIINNNPKTINYKGIRIQRGMTAILTNIEYSSKVIADANKIGKLQVINISNKGGN